jgi:7-keto-8-aminopelargonate synthetase-like enzyme
MAKTSGNKFIDTIDECLTDGVKNGIFQVSLEDTSLNGRTVTIGGKEVVNFGSCSYLGLEVDDRLKQGAIDATIRYGTQYSSSRAFSSCNLYAELEDQLSKIFDNNPAILAATTTLTHISAIPILVQNDDLVILDQQVHGSVQLAVQLVKARGTKVEMIRHSRLDILEDLIKENPNKYNKIWYMIDGVYSMYGDCAPLKELTYLMEKYGNFHLYIDDAHGMSWAGKHGAGYVLSQMELHPKMILTTSLAKGFGTGGGVLIAKDKETVRKILTCGNSYVFSGPAHPPMLGASIASAKIHLSDEIYILQNKLREKLELTKNIIDQFDLPITHSSTSPIFYLALGLPRVGYNMVKRLLNDGFYTNIGIFPGVPVNCTGLRLAVTSGPSNDDIKNMLTSFQYHFPKVLEEEGIDMDKLSLSFKVPFTQTKARYGVTKKNNLSHKFTIQHETSIQKIDKTIWDDLLADGGTFDWEGCRFLEETFCDNSEPENNWNFHYLIIRDNNKKVILATFFTELLSKDDMVAPASVSEQIEEIRKKDKYYLASKVVMMGSLLTEGDHLYIDKTSLYWKDAMIELIRIMNDVKQKSDASMIQLRDIDTDDVDMRDFLIKEGFIRVEMPATHVLENTDKWQDEKGYMETLSTGNRWHFRRKILDKENLFHVNILSGSREVDKRKADAFYKLYFNVKQKSLNLNTYDLPVKLFTNMMSHPNWEIVELRLKSDNVEMQEKEPLISVGFGYRSAKNNYSMMAVGLDYEYVISHGSYRQALYQSVVRANNLKCSKLYFGMDASIEKQRFGVNVAPKSAYIQASDNFNMELIGSVYTKK